MKRILLAIVVGMNGLMLFAQQDPSLTHFIYNRAGINPGSVGIQEKHCATMIYRNQWDKVLGAPNSVVFNLETNLKNVVSGGAGLHIEHDAIGFNRQTSLQLSYAYPISLPNLFGGSTIGVGASLGFMSFRIDPNWIVPTSVNDPVIPKKFNASKFDANFGVFFRSNDGLIFGGIAAKHLASPSFQFINYKALRYYNISGGFGLPAGPLGPGQPFAQLLVRTDFVQATFDLNFRYVLNPFYVGITYRIKDAYAFMAGVDIADNLVLGYSFDLNQGPIATVSRGSHEFVLRKCIPLKGIPVQKTKNVIWL